MNYLSLIKRYKLVVAQRYIFLPVNEFKNLQNDDYFISRKYDGQLWYYVKEKDYSKIINVSERDISKVLPALLNDLDNKTKQHKNLILAGELYFSTNDRERNGILFPNRLVFRFPPYQKLMARWMAISQKDGWINNNPFQNR